MDLGVTGVRGPLALGQCLDLTGFCLVLGVAPGPIVFPTNFPDEWFYYIAETGPFDTPAVFYRTALEAAFAGAGAVADGQQSVFTRRRVRANTVLGGNYTATDFYGVINLPNQPAATTRGINFTEDFGIGVALNFVLATTGPVGPFVTSTTGFVTDPVSKNIYLANPNVPVTVTGGPTSNIFTLTGPDGTFTSNAFTLAGKLTSMQVTPTVMKFPPVTPQRAGIDSAPQTVTILALAALDIPALTVTGTNLTEFRIVASATNPCPVGAAITLAAGASCNFDVIFNGGAAGPADRAANIVIAPTTASAAPATVVLTGQIDAIAPTVVSHFPSTAQSPNNVTLEAVFSEPMLRSSISDTTFTVTALLSGVTTTITGALTFNETTKTLTFDPAIAPEVGALVTVTASTFITDIAGNGVVPIDWTFTAQLPDTIKPKILALAPVASATGVRTDAPITVKFDEQMRADTITTDTFIVTSNAAAVPGTVTYDAATSTATFTPASPLAFGTAYTITITAAVADLAQNTLAASSVTTFFTNRRPTAAVLQSPANGATDVERPVILSWNPATDEDVEDTLTYHLFICNNPAFVGTGANCRVNEAITPVIAQARGVYYASVAGGGLLFTLFGLTFAAGFTGRKKILLMISVLVVTSLFMVSCKKKSSNPAPAPAPTHLTYQVDNLAGGATYYWRIEANDSKGGFTATETQSFKTQ
jgi:hypothetical protein